MNSKHREIRRSVTALLVAGAIFVTGGFLLQGQPLVGWDYLQDHAHTFYVVKSILAGLDVVLVIANMNQIWAESMKLGQRMRYLALFYLVAVIASLSVADAHTNAVIAPKNLFGFFGILFVIIAMTVSMVEAHHSRKALP